MYIKDFCKTLCSDISRNTIRRAGNWSAPHFVRAKGIVLFIILVSSLDLRLVLCVIPMQCTAGQFQAEENAWIELGFVHFSTWAKPRGSLYTGDLALVLGVKIPSIRKFTEIVHNTNMLWICIGICSVADHTNTQHRSTGLCKIQLIIIFVAFSEWRCIAK